MRKKKNITKKAIRVVELFAGVGGFRLGLEGWRGKSASSNYVKKLNSVFQVVWSNQWEPGTNVQHASDIYVERFGDKDHSNEDISKVKTSDIPDHDLLVAGFPCQDYSVAKQLSKSHGIHGKKGVLWWEIHRILEEKGMKRPKYLILENVDRMLKSPANQRGRDFAIILASLNDLGYAVEWRVINAAEYGMPQRRRRVFLLAYHKSTKLFRQISGQKIEWITSKGVFAKAFKADYLQTMDFPLYVEGDLTSITQSFNTHNTKSPFCNSGLSINRLVWTFEANPKLDKTQVTLEDIIISADEVSAEFFIKDKELEKWIYLKGSKKEKRTKRNGEIFYYNEGPLPFPDPLHKPARTIITSEGGLTPSRFKHVIYQDNRYRRLSPIELERANMFPDNFTNAIGDSRRAFLMGNALVVGVIERIGKALSNQILKIESKPKSS